jgi:hypothetical protein
MPPDLCGNQSPLTSGTMMRHWPHIVARTLRCGGMALMRLQASSGSALTPHWVLVAGIEECRHSAYKARLRALLVLDAAQPPPWMCGYNTKLMLTGRDGDSSSAIYNTLDGQWSRVRMVEGISLQPQPMARATA